MDDNVRLCLVDRFGNKASATSDIQNRPICQTGSTKGVRNGHRIDITQCVSKALVIIGGKFAVVIQMVIRLVQRVGAFQQFCPAVCLIATHAATPKPLRNLSSGF